MWEWRSHGHKGMWHEDQVGMEVKCVWRSGDHEGQTRTFHLEQPVQTAIFSLNCFDGKKLLAFSQRVSGYTLIRRKREMSSP